VVQPPVALPAVRADPDVVAEYSAAELLALRGRCRDLPHLDRLALSGRSNWLWGRCGFSVGRPQPVSPPGFGTGLALCRPHERQSRISSFIRCWWQLACWMPKMLWAA